MDRMRHRAGAMLGALAIALLASGCTPEPTPTPSPTGFASEEEAFAAAEATYRAYVDALNQVDLSEPATFEPVYAWTTGDVNATDRKSLTAYHADNVTVAGESQIKLMLLSDQSSDLDAPALAVCLDVSDIDVRNAEGQSLVSDSRPDIQKLTVTFASSPSTDSGLVITHIGPREGEPTC